MGDVAAIVHQGADARRLVIDRAWGRGAAETSGLLAEEDLADLEGEPGLELGRAAVRDVRVGSHRCAPWLCAFAIAACLLASWHHQPEVVRHRSQLLVGRDAISTMAVVISDNASSTPNDSSLLKASNSTKASSTPNASSLLNASNSTEASSTPNASSKLNVVATETVGAQPNKTVNKTGTLRSMAEHRKGGNRAAAAGVLTNVSNGTALVDELEHRPAAAGALPGGLPNTAEAVAEALLATVSRGSSRSRPSPTLPLPGDAAAITAAAKGWLAAGRRSIPSLPLPDLPLLGTQGQGDTAHAHAHRRDEHYFGNHSNNSYFLNGSELAADSLKGLLGPRGKPTPGEELGVVVEHLLSEGKNGTALAPAVEHLLCNDGKAMAPAANPHCPTTTATSTTTTSTSTTNTSTVTTTTTTTTTCRPLPFSPVNVIYIPERPPDVERVEALRSEYGELCGGRQSLNFVHGVYPELWPDGGRFDRFKRVCTEVNEVNNRTGFQNVLWGNTQGWIDSGRSHHLGCGGSHLSVWWAGRQRNASSVMVAEIDGNPSMFNIMTGGCPRDLLGVARAAVEQAPEGWHIIHMDKGMTGSDSAVATRLRVEGSGTQYNLHKWPCHRQAGLAIYLVSRRFMQDLPSILLQRPMDMVDAWLCQMCSEGFLNCYSAAAAARCPGR